MTISSNANSSRGGCGARLGGLQARPAPAPVPATRKAAPARPCSQSTRPRASSSPSRIPISISTSSSSLSRSPAARRAPPLTSNRRRSSRRCWAHSRPSASSTTQAMPSARSRWPKKAGRTGADDADLGFPRKWRRACRSELGGQTCRYQLRGAQDTLGVAERRQRRVALPARDSARRTG